jgi:hypothetical protein
VSAAWQAAPPPPPLGAPMVFIFVYYDFFWNHSVTNSNISTNSNTEVNVKPLRPSTGRLKYAIMLIIMIIIIMMMIIMIVIVMVLNTVTAKLLGISYSHNV